MLLGGFNLRPTEWEGIDEEEKGTWGGRTRRAGWVRVHRANIRDAGTGMGVPGVGRYTVSLTVWLWPRACRGAPPAHRPSGKAQ